MTPEEIAKKLVEDIPIGSSVLAARIAAAIRDAYERAAKRARRNGDPDWMAADILRMRDGLPLDDFGADADGYERRLDELLGEG